MGRGSQKIPMETVHHFQLPTQLFLGQMVQHAGVHQWLHEVAPVLGQTQTGQPIITHPLMVHISISQDLPQRRAKKHAFYDNCIPVYSLQCVFDAYQSKLIYANKYCNSIYCYYSNYHTFSLEKKTFNITKLRLIFNRKCIY